MALIVIFEQLKLSLHGSRDIMRLDSRASMSFHRPLEMLSISATSDSQESTEACGIIVIDELKLGGCNL